MRFYLSELMPAPWRPTMLVPVFEVLCSANYQIVDARADSTALSGWVLLRSDVVTHAEHDLVVADSRISELPFKDANGDPVGLDATAGDVPLTHRNTLQSRLESQHIPFADFTLQTRVRQVLRRFVRRCQLREKLGPLLDYTEGLDANVNSIPNPRRTNIRNRLIELGFNVSPILGTWTIRQTLIFLVEQNGVLTAGEYEG